LFARATRESQDSAGYTSADYVRQALVCGPRGSLVFYLVTVPQKTGNILILDSGRRDNLPVFCKGRTRLHLLTLVNQLSRSRGVLDLFERGLPLPSLALLGALTFFEESYNKGDVYNILWVLVFGFATLNILSLVVKRFDPDRNRMSFGEIMAVMTVLLSVILLGWEMLYLFKILPIRLPSH